MAPVTSEFRQLGDWKPHADQIGGFMEEAFAQNGWDTDEDRFALDVFKRIEQIPPWDIEKRLTTFSGALGDRYDLDANQRNMLKMKILRESVGMFAANAGVITKHAREFISNRVDNKPFTPQQVARMTIESDELVADAIFRMDRVATAMRETMNDEQKARLDRDFRAYDKRLNDMLAQRAEWARGNWKPEQWGLSKDPVQRLAASQPPPNPVVIEDESPATPSAEPTFRPEDETTWERWVRLFIEEHELDPGQITAIRSILTEMQSRAANFRAQQAERLPEVSTSRQGHSPDYAPFRTLFEELKQRSFALLRNTQRSSDAEKDTSPVASESAQ